MLTIARLTYMSLFLVIPSLTYAKPTIDVPRLAEAIHKAEGNDNYGILAKYKHTTYKQACINTIKHRYRLWNGKGDFIEYLGKTYCPIGASNDPKGLNKNWTTNVRYFYAHLHN